MIWITIGFGLLVAWMIFDAISASRKSKNAGGGAPNSRVSSDVSWSGRFERVLSALASGERQAVSRLVDLMFQSPVPVNEPPEGDFAELLNQPDHPEDVKVEGAKTAAGYQEWARKCSALFVRAKSCLEQMQGCVLKGRLFDLTVAASGFALFIEKDKSANDGLSEDGDLSIRAGTTESMNAIRELCALPGQASSNILLKVTEKIDIMVRTGERSHFTVDTLSFADQRQTAREELARRGKPTYNGQAFFDGTPASGKPID